MRLTWRSIISLLERQIYYFQELFVFVLKGIFIKKNCLKLIFFNLLDFFIF
jgi:hypothetical protein